MNEQSNFWKGPAGDAYHQRNAGRVRNNMEFFERITNMMEYTGCGLPKSVIEFGAGIGENLEALKELLPGDTHFWSVEINEEAAQRISIGSILRGSIFDVTLPSPCELVLTKGFLIHIHPDDLDEAYRILYRASTRYILIAEYFNPEPVEVEYRGQNALLWKRDFASELLDRYPDIRVIGYGFAWRRDEYPQDDLTWFLLEKSDPVEAKLLGKYAPREGDRT